jgi:hypothetical protein
MTKVLSFKEQEENFEKDLTFKDQKEKFINVLNEYNETVKYNVLDENSNMQNFSSSSKRLKKALTLLNKVANEYSILIELELEEFKRNNW